MNVRDDRIRGEATAWWRELFDEPPPDTDGRSLIAMIVQRLDTSAYTRLRLPYLNGGELVWPR